MEINLPPFKQFVVHSFAFISPLVLRKQEKNHLFVPPRIGSSSGMANWKPQYAQTPAGDRNSLIVLTGAQLLATQQTIKTFLLALKVYK